MSKLKIIARFCVGCVILVITYWAALLGLAMLNSRHIVDFR